MSQSARAELETIAHMYRQKRYDECIKEAKSKLKKSPNSLHLLNYQAMAYSALKKDREALQSYENIIKKDPTLAGPYYNMGIILKRNGRTEEAIESYRKAISLKPDYVQAYNNLGVLYKDSKQYENAIEMFVKAKEIQPDHQNSYYNLALIKKEQGLSKAFEADTNLVLAKIDTAFHLQLEGNLEKASKVFVNLAKEYPENAEVLWRKSGFDLQLENFEEAWICYEYRWKVFPMNTTKWPLQEKAVWKGEKGKHVALWKEQGIGDDIIFLSLILEVKEMCRSVSVYVDSRLQSLCRRAMPGINFVEDEKGLKSEKCDYHLPMGSLPGLIRNDISDFDRTVTGYLKADPQRVEAIRKELQLDGKRVIGISWKSFKSLHQIKKSVQLKDMEDMFSGLDVVLVNLQYGDVDDEIRAFREETGIEVLQCASVDNREDLDGLAALIEVCDLVISTSNVTVHMAGALAKETWVLLHHVTLHYWLLERPDSIWYPTLRLYRQQTLNDWNGVYSAIRKDLQRKLIKT